MQAAAGRLGIEIPDNAYDVMYSFRHRARMPESISARAPEGHEWVLRVLGRGRYRFVAISGEAIIVPDPMRVEIKVPDATPGIIARYAFTDEQALLAKLRYNRLIDIFTGITCYSLQSHLKTTVGGRQLEADELYVGLDRQGNQYVLPVEAKGGREQLHIVQIEQDIEMCELKFPDLICRPLGAQFMAGDLIALFELQQIENGIAKRAEEHYRLVPPEQISPEDLEAYRSKRERPT